ncbi:MAG: DUF4012 domain-containing protein [Actinomycetes bacterium]
MIATESTDSGHFQPRLSLTNVVIGIVVVAAAISAASAGCHPSGWRPGDIIVTGAVAGLLTWMASRSAPWTLLLVLAPGTVLASNGLGLIGLIAMVVLAITMVGSEKPHPILGAVTGAIGIDLLVRLPTTPTALVPSPPPTGIWTVLAVVACVPMVWTAWHSLAPLPRRRLILSGITVGSFVVIATCGFAVAALSGRTVMSQGIRHAQFGLYAAEHGDQIEAEKRLDQSAKSFSQATRRFDAPWARPARAIPILGTYAAAMVELADSGHDVAQDSAEFARAVPYDHISPRHGQVDLSLIASISAPVAAATSQLKSSSERIHAVNTTWMIPPLIHRIGNLLSHLDVTLGEAEKVGQAIDLVPSMLGQDGPRHYLVLFGNPAESRFGGGYVGAYVELNATAGKVSMGRTGRTAELITDPAVNPMATTPELASRYGPYFIATNPGNVTATPDFPTDAKMAAAVYEPLLGEHIDGVLYADPYGLAALLSLSGPVKVDGLELSLNTSNVAEFLLRDQYINFSDRADRFDFLSEIAHATFDQIINGELEPPQSLFSVLSPAFSQGRLAFVALSPAADQLLTSINATGAFPNASGGDLFGLRTANKGPNKLDSFLERRVHYDATTDASSGEVDAVVTVELTNNAPDGLPTYVSSNRDFIEKRANPRPIGTNTSLVSVYSALELGEIQRDDTTLPATSQPDAGVNTYSVTVDIPRGSTVNLTFRLHGFVTPGPYKLVLAHQPAASDDLMDITVQKAGHRSNSAWHDSFSLSENMVIRPWSGND